MSEVVIIGGGPAGMMAAIAASQNGHRVTLYERNEKLGKKLFITGKGRCNITNDCETEELFSNISRNKRFLYSSFYSFSNWQMMDFLEKEGLPLKTERGNRVFPQSDHSSDVIKTLEHALKKDGVQIKLHSQVKSLLVKGGSCIGVRLTDGKEQRADAVVLATGGCSYSSTGSDGDGYRLAKEAGHHITMLRPSLVPLCTKEETARMLQGLSLKNVRVSIYTSGEPKSAPLLDSDKNHGNGKKITRPHTDGDGPKKLIFQDFGEMLFTHFGVSGPLILSASSIVNDYLDGRELSLFIDLKPALDEKQLDDRLLRDFKEFQNRQLKNALGKLLPSKMIPVFIMQTGISEECEIHTLTKEQRQKIVQTLKHFPLTVTGTRGFQEAIITRGGIDTKEVNASTMESKLIKGLYFAGEILDVDALTGGYNLQIAWSTGHLAGESIL